MNARYQTVCSTCGHPIMVGDTIDRTVSDGQRCWSHGFCLEAARRRAIERERAIERANPSPKPRPSSERPPAVPLIAEPVLSQATEDAYTFIAQARLTW